jgi:hypothetical protein
VGPTHARIISAGRGIFIAFGPVRIGTNAAAAAAAAAAASASTRASAANRDARRNRSAGEAESRQCRSKWIIALSRFEQGEFSFPSPVADIAALAIATFPRVAASCSKFLPSTHLT